MLSRRINVLSAIGIVSMIAVGFCAAKWCQVRLVQKKKQAITLLRRIMMQRSVEGAIATQIQLIDRKDQEVMRLTGSLIGLDCEWVKDRSVALLQLSDTDGNCCLIRLNCLGSIPHEVVKILKNKSILKIGVNIQEDVSKLQREYGVQTLAWVDIRHLAKHFRPNQRKLGLGGLAQEFLGIQLDKNWRISASNWEADLLSGDQLRYAANDAYAAVGSVMAMALEHLEKSIFVYELNYNNVVLTAVNLLSPFANLRFSNKSGINQQQQRQRSGSSKPNEQVSEKPTKRQKHSTRKTPLYNNAKLEAPDGQQLCVCDEGKAKWYVSKGLGHYVSQDPVTVRLTFEPAGRPEGPAGQYYLTEKANNCVVCGKDDSYLRKYIVPHEYRRYFPDIMRDHQSHDILLFCLDCHQFGNLQDLSLRKKLAELCDAPIGTEEDIKVREDFELKKVRSAGRALLNDKKQLIPYDRKAELSQILKDYYGVDDVTSDIMQKGADLETNVPNDNYVPHGKKVVEYFMKEQGIIELEVMWRQHFLDTMKPKFLPPLWCVDHQKQRLDIKAAENRIDPGDYAMAVGSSATSDTATTTVN